MGEGGEDVIPNAGVYNILISPLSQPLMIKVQGKHWERGLGGIAVKLRKMMARQDTAPQPLLNSMEGEGVFWG